MVQSSLVGVAEKIGVESTRLSSKWKEVPKSAVEALGRTMIQQGLAIGDGSAFGTAFAASYFLYVKTSLGKALPLFGAEKSRTRSDKRARSWFVVIFLGFARSCTCSCSARRLKMAF